MEKAFGGPLGGRSRGRGRCVCVGGGGRRWGGKEAGAGTCLCSEQRRTGESEPSTLTSPKDACIEITVGPTSPDRALQGVKEGGACVRALP